MMMHGSSAIRSENQSISRHRCLARPDEALKDRYSERQKSSASCIRPGRRPSTLHIQVLELSRPNFNIRYFATNSCVRIIDKGLNIRAAAVLCASTIAICPVNLVMMDSIKIAVIGAGMWFLHQRTRRSELMSPNDRSKRTIGHQSFQRRGISCYLFREETGRWWCVDRQCRFKIHSSPEEDSSRQ